jgi:hypothetical protein
MIYAYIVISILLCFGLVKSAQKVGSSTKKESLVFLLIIALCGVFHYRMFLYGEVGPIILNNGMLLDVSSFLFFIFICVVPVNTLRKEAENTRD